MWSGKCPVGEMSFRGNVLVGKCPVGEVSSGKCQSGNCPHTIIQWLGIKICLDKPEYALIIPLLIIAWGYNSE